MLEWENQRYYHEARLDQGVIKYQAGGTDGGHKGTEGRKDCRKAR